MIKIFQIFSLLSLSFFTPSVNVDQEERFCGKRNTAWQSGEQINFQVYYTFAGIYVYGGDATFSVRLERMNTRPVYRLLGTGKTNSYFDGFFKVRDRYESYIDTGNLQPLRFMRSVQEGGYQFSESVQFNSVARTATSAKGTISVPDCIQDVLSAIYYARNIDFNRYRPGDKIPFNMYIDHQVHPLYIRYLGKEEVKTRYGRFQAIKFRPLLIEGTIFAGGERMTVWVSNDANRLPVRIESPITVGSINVDMMGYSNLRYALSGLIKARS
ncbi:MAG: DUF3108 domain-containing protein [Chitinophagaceae bacterium]